jgi:mono/diheme cytochrome c family protein
MPNRPLVSSDQVRGAFLISTLGVATLIIGILLLATSRPQGRLVAVDDSLYQQRLVAAEEALSGFALVGEGAQLDINYAMQLVVERGVTLPLYAGGVAPTVPPAGAVLAEAAVPDGAALYSLHCMACHQATGGGIPMAFPPLVGHVGQLASVDRAYPAKVIMFGLMGPIEVLGSNYMGVMTGLAPMLSDAEVAALLNHVITTFDPVEDFEAYRAEEIADWRQLALQMTDTHSIRMGLPLP